MSNWGNNREQQNIVRANIGRFTKEEMIKHGITVSENQTKYLELLKGMLAPVHILPPSSLFFFDSDPSSPFPFLSFVQELFALPFLPNSQSVPTLLFILANKLNVKALNDLLEGKLNEWFNFLEVQFSDGDGKDDNQFNKLKFELNGKVEVIKFSLAGLCLKSSDLGWRFLRRLVLLLNSPSNSPLTSFLSSLILPSLSFLLSPPSPPFHSSPDFHFIVKVCPFFPLPPLLFFLPPPFLLLFPSLPLPPFLPLPLFPSPSSFPFPSPPFLPLPSPPLLLPFSLFPPHFLLISPLILSSFFSLLSFPFPLPSLLLSFIQSSLHSILPSTLS